MDTWTIIIIILSVLVLMQIITYKNYHIKNNILSNIRNLNLLQNNNENAISNKNIAESENVAEPENVAESENIAESENVAKPENVAESDSIEDKKETTNKNEVFHVGPNNYSYLEAQAVCESLGSRLAKEDEIKDAWKNGANWCNYGWSDKQKAFYPIQKNYWNTRNCLKKENEPHPCGEIGVNGGFFSNPHIRYGANCYGVKPERSDKQIEREKKWNKNKDKYKHLLYKNMDKNELDKLKNEHYNKILNDMKKNNLVDELYEFNNLKVKWSRHESNNDLSNRIIISN